MPDLCPSSVVENGRIRQKLSSVDSHRRRIHGKSGVAVQTAQNNSHQPFSPQDQSGFGSADRSLLLKSQCYSTDYEKHPGEGSPKIIVNSLPIHNSIEMPSLQLVVESDVVLENEICLRSERVTPDVLKSNFMDPPKHVNESTGGSASIGKVHLMGSMQIIDGRGVDITPKGQVRKVLFALLSTSRNGIRSRSYLQSILWGDRDEKQASASLRNAISVLKTELASLGADILISDNFALKLNLTKLQFDIHSLEKVSQSEGLKAVDIANDDFLQGIDLPGGDNEEFEAWLRTQREYFKRLQSEYKRKDEVASSLVFHAQSAMDVGVVHGPPKPR